jgi:hypothetical protein
MNPPRQTLARRQREDAVCIAARRFWLCPKKKKEACFASAYLQYLHANSLRIPGLEGTGGVARKVEAGASRSEHYRQLIPVELATPWLTELVAGGASAGRLDVLSAWAVRSEEQPLLGWKKDVFIRRNNEPYPIS